MRLGGNGAPWGKTARETLTFVDDGSTIVIVAASGSAVESKGGAAVAYRLVGDSFIYMNHTDRDPGASCLAHFYRQDEGAHFVAVGNSHNPDPSAPSVNIYRWSNGTLLFDHSLSLDSSDPSTVVYASKLKSITIAGSQYLAVAHMWDGTTYDVASYIYKWEATWERPPQPSGVFRPVQLIPIRGCSEVDAWRFGNFDLLFLASFVGPSPLDNRGNVTVFYFDHEAGRYVGPIQTIGTMGATDVEPFSIPGDRGGHFVAIANRQSGAPLSEGDLTVYDQESVIYEWTPGENIETSRFKRWQSLANISTVQSPHSSDYVSDLFCAGVSCSIAQDGTTRVLPGLRGATGFTAFSTGGEWYLAVAQSVCEAWLTNAKCSTQSAQPKSAVLQYDHVTRSFGALLSLTARDNLRLRGRGIADEERFDHSYSLRISAGRATSWTFAEATGSGRPLLILSSMDVGAIAYEFDFDRAVGFQGVVGATVLSQDERIYAASSVDASLVVLRHETLYDSLGRSTGPCPAGKPCLRFTGMVSEAPVVSGRTVPPTEGGAGGIQGLSGAKRIISRCDDGQGSGSLCSVAVMGGLPRDELKCGPAPPLPASIKGNVGLPAECQGLNFTVSPVGDVRAGLFEVTPRIEGDGSLVFETAQGASGDALFSIRLQDSGGLAAELANVLISVAVVNNAPTFTAHDIYLNEGAGQQTLVFSADVSPGPQEDSQGLTFFITGSSGADLFVSQPVTSINNNFGLIRFEASRVGVASFNVTLVDDGPSDFPNTNTSKQAGFRVVVRGVNKPPTFSVASNLTLERDGPEMIVANFVQGISAGAEGEEGVQRLEFLPPAVTVVDSLWSTTGLFDKFELSTVDGSLVIKMAPGRSGYFEMSLTLKDDGGQAFGGFDRTTKTLMLVVLPLSEPELRALPTIRVAQSDAAVVRSFPSFYSLFLGNSTLDIQLALTINSITNTEMYLQLPEISATGDLTFTPNAMSSGVSQVVASIGGSVQEGALGSHRLTIFVDSVNDPPSFNLVQSLSVAQGVGQVTIPGAAYSISSGPSDEDWQTVTFSVSYTTSSPTLTFISPPTIGVDGSLSFEANPLSHGVATLTVRAGDDGGTENGGVDQSQGAASLLALTIFPLPRVDGIKPGVGTLSGGGLVTVKGSFFGSVYSRGYAAAEYEGAAVYIGGMRCSGERIVSDTQIVCTAPRGIGAGRVTVNISDSGTVRGGFLAAKSYSHNLVYYGGALVGGGSGDAGFVGMGPRSGVPITGSPFADASMHEGAIKISRWGSALSPL